ncbi:hypothetical protein BCR36DRAFT_413161 [Piromyces finnis]|uniref:Uncharacterized protein n=1 Tax=Piromyces finnis TaxID=1754191 RepID=A0A1Y1V7L3_9FUNG|nr:hypothetical protein BCR36DRAFT_413161 [Piromyces finnis]|eukprot:ORX48396.1 hypothetical protein BCR36DRAFT_413161 [Piromyces finnis]
MEYFGIDEKVLYPSSSFLSNDSSIMESKPKRSLGKLRGSVKEKKDKSKKGTNEANTTTNQLRRNLSKKKVERPATTIIRKEVNAMWNEALKEERNYIREHSPDRVSRITTLSNVQGLNGNKRYQEPQSFGKRTNMNLDFSIPMPYEKKKGTLFRNSNGNRRKIFSKTWWSNVPIGAYLFFLGFLFPPLWYVGAICRFRKDNTVEAEIERSKSKKNIKKSSTKDVNREWRSKINKNKTNNGNINQSHVEFSNIEDPENSESWNWGMGGVGEPEAINVNFMSGIEEFEKHKLAENEKWWRKINILMSVLFTLFILGILVIKRKQIFGGNDSSSTSSNNNSYSTLNGNFKGNNENNGGVISSSSNDNLDNNNNSSNNSSNKIPLNNFGRDGNGGELVD